VIFARDRAAVAQASHALRNATGNFYVNDKPTGAVIGQQPFGGARASNNDNRLEDEPDALGSAGPSRAFSPPAIGPIPT
jgi:1-pyrroline-5-carboxylate dehydrogenase